jgi:LEA14-like dessication related protein
MRALMIFLTLALALTACISQKAAQGPAEGVLAIEYDRLDFVAQAVNGSTYGFKFLVNNGTFESKSFDKVEWKFEFNGKETEAETTAISLDVPGGKSGTFEVQVKVEYPKDAKEFMPFLKKRSVPYRLTGTVSGPGGSFPVKAEYDVGLPELPTVKVPGAAIASGDKGEVGFSFDIFVKNPNVFPMKVDYVSYNLEIEGVPVGSGRIAEMEKVPSNSDLAYTFPAKMDLKEHGVKIKEMLGKKSMEFVITGVLSVEGIELPVQESGVIKFTR